MNYVSIEKAIENGLKEYSRRENGIKTILSSQWFSMLQSFDPGWNRSNDNTVYMYVSSWDRANAAESKIREMKGIVLEKKGDPQSGKIFMLIREPKGLKLEE